MLDSLLRANLGHDLPKAENERVDTPLDWAEVTASRASRELSNVTGDASGFLISALPVGGELLKLGKITRQEAKMRDVVIVFVHLIVVPYPQDSACLCSWE